MGLPRAFLWRRFHSLMGVWLVLFLVQHLFVNSQAALDQESFIRSANALESLPYLPLVELLFLAIPIAIHALFGILYIRTAEYNSWPTDGSTPALTHFPNNQAYTWQRLTAWVLLFGIAAHVVHMRFLERPEVSQVGDKKSYTVTVTKDNKLSGISERLGVELYEGEQEEVVAVAPDFGRAELLVIRNIFKEPLMLVGYTLLVLFACFHAFDGLWTACIKWGITRSARSQAKMRLFFIALMILTSFLGLSAVWGTY